MQELHPVTTPDMLYSLRYGMHDQSSLPQAPESIREVTWFSRLHLSMLQRMSGESYAEHGEEVAEVLREVTDDESLLRIAVLHDVLVHPDGGPLLHQSPLSSEEKKLVQRMHQLRGLHIDENTDDLDRAIGAFTEDSRLLMLRMAHRLNDVRHLNRFPKKRQKQIAHETLHMYTAISGRLGFQRWRWQMEDICFLSLQPRIAGKMQRQFQECATIDHATLGHARQFLLEALRKNDIRADIDERIKGLYSTYRKMVLKNRSFEELTDRLALRILVPTVSDCYRALGIIHGCMRPMETKLKDYIGNPKENGYRSIHTVIYPLPGVTELPIEIQIRTFVMHRECEYGIASHNDYKDWSYALTTKAARVNLFRNLESLQSIARSHSTFRKALARSFDDKRLLLFDPQNNLYHLPKPSTAMDFACASSPDTCHLAAGVRINGREQSLGTLLRDGDTVEIIVGEKPVALRERIKDCQQKHTRRLLKKAWEKSASVT